MSAAPYPVVEVDLFRDAMRMTASGVAVVTTDGEAGRAGVTVSSLCSLSMEPPSVVFDFSGPLDFVKKSAGLSDCIDGAKS